MENSWPNGGLTAWTPEPAQRKKPQNSTQLDTYAFSDPKHDKRNSSKQNDVPEEGS